RHRFSGRLLWSHACRPGRHHPRIRFGQPARPSVHARPAGPFHPRAYRLRHLAALARNRTAYGRDRMRHMAEATHIQTVPGVQRAAGYYLAFITLGLASASIGPVLPRLAEQVAVGVSAVSIIFTAR